MMRVLLLLFFAYGYLLHRRSMKQKNFMIKKSMIRRMRSI